MTGSRHTLLQRFVLDVVPRFPQVAGEAIQRAAYDAGEEPRPAYEELEAYYALCDYARGLAARTLCRIGLVDYANFLDRTRVIGVDGAIEVGLTISTALTVLEREAIPSGLEPFVRAAQTVLYETRKAVEIAVEVDDPEVERQNLRVGTAASARAFVAARVFVASPADEAREIAQAMRSVRPPIARPRPQPPCSWEFAHFHDLINMPT